MANYHLRHEMKQLAVIVAIYAKHGDVETARSLEAAWSFAHTMQKKLEVSSGDVSHVVKYLHCVRIRTASTGHYRCESRNVRNKEAWSVKKQASTNCYIGLLSSD